MGGGEGGRRGRGEGGRTGERGDIVEGVEVRLEDGLRGGGVVGEVSGGGGWAWM